MNLAPYVFDVDRVARVRFGLYCVLEKQFHKIIKNWPNCWTCFWKLRKKGLETKEKIIEQVRTLVDAYDRVFVYSLDNSRNNHLKDLRAEFKTDSRSDIQPENPSNFRNLDFIREKISWRRLPLERVKKQSIRTASTRFLSNWLVR